MLRQSLMLILIIAIPFLITSVGCVGNEDNALTTARPLYVGVADDVSGSVEEIELQPLTPNHIDKIMGTLKNRGGSIAFGLIDENAFVPLRRLNVEPVSGRLDVRAHKNQQNQKAILDFKNVIESKVRRPRNAPRTDIKGSIMRFRLFFGEPNIPRDAELVFLFISDGKDTRRRYSTDVELPANVKVYVVGTEPSLAHKLFGGRVTLFESIDAAIEALNKPFEKSQVSSKE